MANWSTTAWFLHDLGLATSFGGSVFGKLALDPAVREIRDKHERARVLDAAWKRFNVINVLAHVGFAATWLIGRAMRSGRELPGEGRRLVLAKDALVAAALATGVGSVIAGLALGRAYRRTDAEVESGVKTTPQTPAEVARLQRVTNVLGAANVACEAGVLAATTALAMRSGRSMLWSVSARRLP